MAEPTLAPETPSAVILRFRDLVTMPGHTIELHAKLAETKGHVWWAWWNKSGEAVAANTWNRIVKSLGKADAPKFYLFDSGHIGLRTVTCLDIKWDTSYDVIQSPSSDETPDYYRNQKYVLWFQLKDFGEQLPDDEAIKILQGLSYLRVDEFFTNQKSRYTTFYNKRIHSLDELKQQDRTIWFARPFRGGDATHAVSLTSNFAILPAHFPERWDNSKSRNLLWVSDLHFGAKHGFAAPGQGSTHTLDLGSAIEVAAKKHDVNDFGGLIVSGDLTWQASKDEFADARKFLQRVTTSPSKLESYRIAMCPGNHDLAFSDDPALKTKPIDKTIEEAQANYRALCEELFYIAPNDFLSMGRRILLKESSPVEIVCLNSSLLQQAPEWFQGHGFVGQAQLSDVVTQYSWSRADTDPRPFRIVVLHHHLLPVTFSEKPEGDKAYSVMLDAERVIQWLARYRVDLVLHGHMHETYYARLRRPVDVAKPNGESHEITILGMGSTGVDGSHRDTENCFGVISFEHRAVVVRVLTASSKGDDSKLLNEIRLER